MMRVRRPMAACRMLPARQALAAARRASRHRVAARPPAAARTGAAQPRSGVARRVPVCVLGVGLGVCVCPRGLLADRSSRGRGRRAGVADSRWLLQRPL